MQTLALHDTLEIRKSNDFRLTCTNPRLPTDGSNLVTRAAKHILQECNINQSVHIHLVKRIPVSAGLAGGSANCAATLIGINALFGLNIPLYGEGLSLMQLGRSFGADVPFCIVGGTALAEGIGEKITPLPSHPHTWVLLACPVIPVSTADIFSRFVTSSAYSTVKALEETLNDCDVIPNHCNITAMKKALANKDIVQIAANFSNNLAHITANIHPVINILIDEMKTQGAIAAAMSGSGPSVYGYFSNKETAKKAKENLKHITGRIFLTKVL